MRNSKMKGVITLLLCLIALQAAAALQITNVTAPSQVYEGAILHLAFSSNEPADYLIYKDGIELTTTPEYNEILDYQSAGLYTFTFVATKGNQSINTTRQVEVLDNQVNLNIIEPKIAEYNKAVPIHVKTTKPVTLCYVTVNQNSHTLNKINDTTYNGSLNLKDGPHTLQVKCKFSTEIISQNKTIIVDSTPPKITLTPSGTTTQYPITLKAITDEIATCTYAQGSLETENGLTHTTQVRPSGGTHTIEVTCKDTLKNNQTKSTTFTLNRPPTAKINVDDNNPHKAGKYEITLEVSEELASPPTLSIAFDSGGNKKIPLEKDTNTQYTGVLIIEEDFGNRVGQFSFSGTGISGLSGSGIDEAPLFITDTTKPAEVKVFRAINSSNKVNLTWFYDGEDDVKFNIYRTTGDEVDYTDFYTVAVGDNYEDYQIGDAVTYYYRIAAVDDAGNVGPLSKEQSASPAKTQFVEEKQELILDPLLQVAVDTRLRELETWILDANRLATDLKSTTDAHQSKMLVELGVIDKMQQEQAKLTKVKEELQKLKKLQLDKAVLEERMSQEFEIAIAARGAMPKSLTITNKADYTETTSDDDLKKVATATNSNLKESRKLIDTAAIKTTISHITIEYQDNTNEEFSVVEKQLTFTEPQERIIVIESLPDVESEPQFINSKPQKLEQGQYQLSFDSIKSERILYKVPGTVDFARLRSSRLIPLRQSLEIEQAVDNEITGNSILPDISSIANTSSFAIVLGLIVIASLLFYYFKIQDEPFPLPIQQVSNPQSIQTQFIPQNQSKSTIVIERKDTHLTQLLMSGNMLIDQNKYLDALYFYKKSLEKYNPTDYTPQVNLALKAELQLLYRKLLLAKEMSTAHDAIIAQDSDLLEASMQNMREHATVIGPESGIVERAEHSYRYFYSQWNSLKAHHYETDMHDKQDL